MTYALGGARRGLVRHRPGHGGRSGWAPTRRWTTRRTRTFYEVTVTATDSLGLSATVTVTIAVTNVGLG